MAKSKNPKRVAAGKKAYATAKRRGTSAIGGGSGKKRSGKPKLPSLAKSITIVGGAVLVTGLGATQTAALLEGVNSAAAEAGIGVAVTGAGLVIAVNALKAAAHLSPWFGRKYRAFLKGYGLRP